MVEGLSTNWPSSPLASAWLSWVVPPLLFQGQWSLGSLLMLGLGLCLERVAPLAWVPLARAGPT